MQTCLLDHFSVRALLVGAALVISTGVGNCQSWTETTYHSHDKHYHYADVLNVWAGTGETLSVSTTFFGRFIVTGSTNTTPAWRTAFATLCNNPLYVTEAYSDVVPVNKNLTCYATWYLWGPHSNDWCTDSAHESSCGYSANTNSFTDGTVTISRALREKICERLWYELTDLPSGGGGGGGGS